VKNGRSVGFLIILLFFVLFIGGLAAYKMRSHAKYPKAKSAHVPVYVEPPFKHPMLFRPDSLRDSGNFDLAHYAYLASAASFLEKKNWKGYVWSLNGAGSTGIRGNYHESGLSALQKSLLAGKQHLGINHRYVSNTFYFLGEYYYLISNASKSLAFHKQALKSRIYLFGKNGNMVADSYQQIAQVYQYLVFDYAKAEAYIDSVLQITQKAPERNLRDEASICYDLVAVNRLKGDLERALLYANKYMVMAEELGDSNLLELAHSTTGSIYYSQADYKNSIFHLRKAIGLNRTNKPAISGQNNISYYYNDLGNAFLQTGNFRLAAQSFHDALKAPDRSLSSDTLSISNSYASLGNLYLKQLKFDSARFYFDKCLFSRLAYYGRKHYKTSQAYKNLASLSYQTNRFDQALMYYQQAAIAAVPEFTQTEISAVPTIEMIGARYELIDILGSKGKVLIQNYVKSSHNKADLILSLSCFQTADSLIQKYAESYGSESSRLLLAQESHAIYEQALACTLLLSEATHHVIYNSYAFYFMERSKSQLLLQGIRRAEQLNTELIPDSLRNLEKELSFKINTLQQQQDEQVNRSNNEKAIQKIRSQLLEVNVQYRNLQKRMDSRYPFLKASGTGKQTASLYDLQQSLKDTSRQFIMYFWGDSSIYMLGITARNSKFTKISKTKGLMETFTGFVRNLSGKGEPLSTQKDHQYAFTVYTRQAYSLYQNLVKPALMLFSDSSGPSQKPLAKLVIIPDGPLAYLPFSTLLTRLPHAGHADYHSLSYLLFHYQSSYAYSATLLAHQEQYQSGSAATGVLALAYSADASDSANQPMQDQIPGTVRELDAIEHIMKGRYLKGNEATEQTFINNASKYQILHLAVHGKTDEKSKYESRLVFNPEGGRSGDGILYAHELYNLNLGARLVVLSACETALGRLFSGEGVFSMARGFTFGGCPSLIMSLWKVDDAATTNLMAHLYERLEKGFSINESLESSQRNYLRTHDELTAHPRYWAGFIASGNMAPLETDKPYLWIAVFSVAVFLVTVFLVTFKKR
jgi:CHAT domain-containing protein